MQNPALYQDYHELENTVKKHMLEAVNSGSASQEDVETLAYILSKTENLEELSLIIRILVNKYPFFENLIQEEKGEIKADIENIVQQFVSELVVSDPLKAAEISAEAAKPEATIESLKTAYPEFAEYLNKHPELT